ncbi:MAG: DUF5060 domain-containing protein, partial [Bacteroidales bacterium]|nr:DUF5060 domain-containing protein [Bacteroidales bacterium]
MKILQKIHQIRNINARFIFIVLILVVVLLVQGFTKITAPSRKVKQWKRTDIELLSAKTYVNPFLDVAIEAVFTHTKSGESITLPGFWNGGNRWVVRFSPVRTGEWQYVIKSNDASNAGLF